MPSTLANIVDLLADYKRVIKNNNNMSIFYILYQVIILIFTLTGPGSIFIMLIGSFESTFGVENHISIIINAIPLILFIIVCLVGKSDTQIILAQVLSILYAMLMMAVFISILIQILNEGYSSPNLLALGLVLGPIFLAAILHPQVCNDYCFF